MSFITDKEIRSYLLGTLADEPREQIEDTLLIGDEGLLRLEIAEEDLIEDFLDDQLDAEQLALFQSHFLCTKARKEKLAYLRAIRAVAARQTEPEPATGKVINFPATQTRRSFFVGMNRSSYLKLAAAILIVGSVGFLVWRYAFRPSQSASIVALNRAYAGGRTLETRIGGLDFAPYAPTRGANDADANARILRERAALIVLNAYAENPTAANRHALGKYYLADKQFDKAIEQFNAALKETPTVAELHNDLGAALLEKSKFEKRNNQPGDSLQHMAASLESIEQALKLQPNYPAAVFNRALCLQEMYLPRQAIEEWKKYLQLDGKSPWADEARRRLAELEKAPSNISKSDDELYQDYLKDPANDERTFDLFCQSYSTIGNGITERLIDSYLAAKSHGDAAAADKLNLLEQLGKLIYQRTTDPYVRDVVRYYRQLPARLLPKLIEARHHLKRGRDLRSTSQSQAVANYEQAIALFRQAQDQCEVKMTTCLLARSHLRQLNLNKSRELFEALASPKNPYHWIRGESLNGIADYYQNQNNPDECIRTNQMALVVAEQIKNFNLSISSFGGLAEQYSDLGVSGQSLFVLEKELELFSRRQVSRQQLWFIVGQTAKHLFSMEYLSAAISYQQEALRIELVSDRPLQLSRTYTQLGIMLGKDSRFAEAARALQDAVNIGVALGNERLGLLIQAYSGRYLAELHRKAGNYSTALLTYDYVIELCKYLNNPSSSFEVYRGKALAEIAMGNGSQGNQDLAKALVIFEQNRNQFLAEMEGPSANFEVFRGKALTEIALGNTAQANKDLSQALAIFERNRNQILIESERNTYFDKEFDIYDTAISLAYADNSKEAFDLTEKSRARSLLELFGGRGLRVKNPKNTSAKPSITIQPKTSKNIQSRIPQNTYVLEYACLPDRILVWCISSKYMTHQQVSIPLHLLEQKVQIFMRSLDEKNPSNLNHVQALSAELYKYLIEPFELFLANADSICIVPDKILHHLPFAALYSASQKKYVIENYTLISAPSASVFVSCIERTNQTTPASNGLLAIGNPRFDPTTHPQLTDLIAATREVNEIARYYNKNQVLTGEEAMERTVKVSLRTARVLHLATHSVIDERDAANSSLILAKSTTNDGEDGLLHAYEISQMKLAHLRFVVLSACQSGVEHFYRGEGMIGLSRAFLSAGVPSVVASFWAVDSDVSAELMTDFHKQLKTYSVSQALRQAQLNMLNSSNLQHRHPYYWAAFSTFGADVSL